MLATRGERTCEASSGSSSHGVGFNDGLDFEKREEPVEDGAQIRHQADEGSDQGGH